MSRALNRSGRANSHVRVCLLKTQNLFVGYELAPVTSTLCVNDVDATSLPFGAASLRQITR
jgi:hypothetical protein